MAVTSAEDYRPFEECVNKHEDKYTFKLFFFSVFNYLMKLVSFYMQYL